jgi:hypothetical protein
MAHKSGISTAIYIEMMGQRGFGQMVRKSGASVASAIETTGRL